ncbi:MAG: type II secretion system minor pseudopilin GspK [Pseudomonadota bacterium]
MKRSPPNPQSGAALITVLLIVAAMSGVAVALTSGLTNALQRTSALEAQSQLRLYAASAEEVAEAQLGTLFNQFGGKLNAESPGMSEPIRFPLERGLVEITVFDASNCFNVNLLASSEAESASQSGGTTSTQTELQEDLVLILESAELDRRQAQELVAAMVDWMDPDLIAELGGAEDSFYSDLDPPYRTSGLAFETDSELRAVRGFDPLTLAEIGGLACVIPSKAQRKDRPINVNTLPPEHAARLMPVFNQAVDVSDLQQILAGRPLAGWSDLESFLSEPPLDALIPEAVRRNELSIVSTHVAISAKVAYRGHGMVMNYLFEVEPGRAVTLLRRERVS